MSNMKPFIFIALLVLLKLNLVAQDIEFNFVVQDSTNQKNKNFSKSFNSIKELEDFKQNNIDELYQRGYLNLEVDSISSTRNKVIQYVRLHQRIDSIIINIPDEYIKYLSSSKKDLKQIKIEIEEWGDMQKQLLSALRSNGYDFAKVYYSPISIEKNYLNAILELEVNELKKFNEVYIRGYDEFPEAFRKNHIRIKKGSIYTEKKLKRRTKSIQNIDFVNEIKNPEVQFTKDSVNVFLYLEKNKINSFDGFIGFSNEQESSGLALNGYLDVLLKNNLNLGESLVVRYKNDGQEQQIFRTKIAIPFIFKTRLTPEAGIEIFRQDSTFARNTQEVRLGYHINHQWEIFGDLERINSSNLLESQTDEQNLNPINDFTSQFYGMTTRFNNRKQNIGEIINRDFAELRLLQGNRNSSSNNTSQIKIEFYGETLQKLIDKTYLHMASSILILNSEDYLDNELFRVGGLRSMRGFDENSLISSSFYSLQTEFRYFLSTDLYANTVLDYGYYQNKLINLDENLFSFGFGIGLNTRGGLLRLIFANGRSSQQEFNFQNTQVHLSLNTFF